MPHLHHTRLGYFPSYYALRVDGSRCFAYREGYRIGGYFALFIAYPSNKSHKTLKKANINAAVITRTGRPMPGTRLTACAKPKSARLRAGTAQTKQSHSLRPSFAS